MSDTEQLTNAVTLGEVNRKVDTVVTAIGALSQQVGQLPTYRDFTGLEQRVSNVESWQTWALRLVVGAVLIAVVGVVLAAKTGTL